MLIMDAVLEVGDTADFVLWPIADVPAYQFVRLSSRMSSLEVGTATATLTDYNSAASGNDVPALDASEPVRRLTEAERVIAPGGLRVRDSDAGTEISPGCCSGLEDWREWFILLDGEVPWLGHSPTPRVEHAGRVVRLWPDGGDAEGPSPDHPVEIAVADILGLLRTVQGELSGFVSAVE
ncbi:hypothetical protein ACFYXS_07995 [Streptomyces sp. NPDC002574]|uniref:hypothetical protein n=1 Tax=Streptomyces sp. NPDC002574 TaxID=3364652 RepID=UPI0036CFE765